MHSGTHVKFNENAFTNLLFLRQLAFKSNQVNTKVQHLHSRYISNANNFKRGNPNQLGLSDYHVKSTFLPV